MKRFWGIIDVLALVSFAVANLGYAQGGYRLPSVQSLLAQSDEETGGQAETEEMLKARKEKERRRLIEKGNGTKMAGETMVVLGGVLCGVCIYGLVKPPTETVYENGKYVEKAKSTGWFWAGLALGGLNVIGGVSTIAAGNNLIRQAERITMQPQGNGVKVGMVLKKF